MKRTRENQRGVALLEMTALLIVSVPLLAALVVCGRLTWHAIVMEKSTANASRIVSALPPESFAIDTGASELRALVYAHISGATAAAGVAAVQSDAEILVACNGAPCMAATPDRVSVATASVFRDTVFSGAYTEGLGLPAQATIQNTYEQSYALPTFPVRVLPAPN
jgi:hypothetical protein